MYGSTWLAHRVSQSGQIQEDPQEHHDQYDGHPGGGHTEAGRRLQLRHVTYLENLNIKGAVSRLFSSNQLYSEMTDISLTNIALSTALHLLDYFSY